MLNKIVKSFEKKSEGGRFIVVGKEALELSFSANTRDAESVVVAVPLHLHEVNGDHCTRREMR